MNEKLTGQNRLLLPVTKHDYNGYLASGSLAFEVLCQGHRNNISQSC